MRWWTKMKQILKGIIIGFLFSIIIAIFGILKYGDWKEKIGYLKGKKEGMITIIDFLGAHFPEPDGRSVPQTHTIGLKWYRINVIKKNGIPTLQVKNKM